MTDALLRAGIGATVIETAAKPRPLGVGNSLLPHVVAGDREMHGAGATQRPDDLAQVTGKYTVDAHAERIPL